MSNTFAEAVTDAIGEDYVDVEGICDKLGVSLEYTQPNEYKPEFSGSIKKVGDSYRILINSDHPEGRQRFTIAHELAHYFLHQHIIDRLELVDTALYRSGQPNEVEREANIWAAAILMPHKLIKKHEKDALNQGLKSNSQVLEYIANKMKVSKQVLAISMGIRDWE